jgi:hypothetical protein
MTIYKDIDNDSGVSTYEYGADYIVVQFKDGGKYEYTHQSAGMQNIEQMKLLADQGDGLNAFINRYVRKRYSRKL